MKLAQSVLIFCIGLFAIVSQALLFREFLVVFEGNELGVGAFFGSWFLWIAVGAFIAYRCGRRPEVLCRRFELVSLLYIPAFLVQFLLIGRAREIMGIDPYQLFGFADMTLGALIVNAPLSFVTGLLFPLACRWIERQGRLPVSRVYIIEAAGSFAGGLVVTVLLSQGVGGLEIFLGQAALLALAALMVLLIGKRWWSAFVPAGLVVAAVYLGMTQVPDWSTRLAQEQWQRLLPGSQFLGTFQTAQGQYLYGRYQGQFLISSYGQICEALPDEENAGTIAAVHLCQNPGAKRVLIAGADLTALSQAFLKLPQVEEITLSSVDLEYISKIESIVPQAELFNDERVIVSDQDLRGLLAGRKDYFDLIILNFSDATTALLNRYRTVEFYRLVKESLASGGVMGTGVSGGENVMGTELVQLGASCLRTMEEVFGRVAIKPGEHTWLLAGDRADLSEQSGILRDRFEGIESGRSIYPVEGILSLYQSDRIEFTRTMYQGSNLPDELLINRDERPLGHLYSLLLLGRHSKSVFSGLVRKISLCGYHTPAETESGDNNLVLTRLSRFSPYARFAGVFLMPIIVLVILRLVYLHRHGQMTGGGVTDSTFNSKFLVFSTGLISIGSEIVLMYLLQSRYGYLFLYVGLIASLFMLGLVVGGIVSRGLVQTWKVSWQKVALVTMVVHLALLVSAIRSGAGSNITFFISGFILCGLLTGLYFPPAAKALETAGAGARQAGGSLDLMDHLGGACGGVLTGILFISILGTTGTFVVLAVIIAANAVFIIAELLRQRSLRHEIKSAAGTRSKVVLPQLGYVCLGVGLCLIISSHVVVRAARVLQRPDLTDTQAQELAGGESLQRRQVSFGDGFDTFIYYEIVDGDRNLKGYVYSTRQLTGNIYGYGGPIELLVRVGQDFQLENFVITRSNETPAYLEMLTGWPESLRGYDLLQGEPEVAAISGATISCEAIKAILSQSARRFARDVLGRDVMVAEGSAQRFTLAQLDRTSLYLVTMGVAAILISRVGGRWLRRGTLLICVVAGGWFFNMQYSSEHVITILSGAWPKISLSQTFLLVVVVPLVVFLLGNIYCGYLCPFGAIQEIISFILPVKWRTLPTRETMRWARFGKYIMLLVLVCLFFLSWDRQVLESDILTGVFSRYWSEYHWEIIVFMLLASLVFVRFWCRYLCPAGAFLAIVGFWAPLKRILPRKVFARCDLGVAGPRELDCINCDRCRFEITSAQIIKSQDSDQHASRQVLNIIVSVSAALFIILLASSSVRIFARRIWPDEVPSAVRRVGAGGIPRNVDMERLLQLIEQDKLSNHEAQFYRQVEEGEDK
ncbi:MAG: 4Fe-4S binding protein [Sedimentisphaerales bacterium]|nr:4Fe-4S binding protein [Sedimentisphaerales bacterium]